MPKPAKTDASSGATGSRAPRLVIAVFGLVLLLYAAYQFQSGKWAADLGALYFGSRAYGLGLIDAIYVAPEGFFGRPVTDPRWIGMATDLGIGGQSLLPFVYAPLFAALLSPIAVSIGPQAFFDGALLIQLPLLFAAVSWAPQTLGSAAPRAEVWIFTTLLVCGASVPFFFAVDHVQPQMTVTAAVLGSFALYRRNHPVWAGIVLVLPIALKLWPAIFVAIYLADRNWRAFLASTATGALLLLVSLLWLGPEIHLDFLGQLGRANSMMVVSNYNFGAEGLWVSLRQALGQAPLDFTSAQPFVVVARDSADKIFFAALLVLVSFGHLWACTKGPENLRLWRQVMGLWCAAILFGPLGWAHYALGPLLLAPGILAARPLVRARLVLVLVAVALSILTAWLPPEVIDGIQTRSLLGILALAILLSLAILPPVRQ